MKKNEKEAKSGFFPPIPKELLEGKIPESPKCYNCGSETTPEDCIVHCGNCVYEDEKLSMRFAIEDEKFSILCPDCSKEEKYRSSAEFCVTMDLSSRCFTRRDIHNVAHGLARLKTRFKPAVISRAIQLYLSTPSLVEKMVDHLESQSKADDTSIYGVGNDDFVLDLIQQGRQSPIPNDRTRDTDYLRSIETMK